MGEKIRYGGAVAWALVGLAALLLLVGFVGWYVRVIFPPLILAAAIVFILNPVVTFLQRHHVPRAAGAAMTYLGIIAMAVGFGVLSAPLITDQADEFSAQWPEVREDIEAWVNDISDRSKEDNWIVEIPNVDEIRDQLDGEGSSGGANLGDAITTARRVGTTVFHIALIFVLGPILAFYFLVDLPHLRKVLDSLIPDQARDDVYIIGRRLNRAIGGFFRGQLVVAFIVGLMVSSGLFVIDLPFWLIVGMIAGMFNLIPLIGPWVGAVPGIVIALTTRDPGTAVWVAVIMAGAQQIDNHFISPLVMQRAVRLHPAAVMMALLAGGTLGGFFGLLMAVPVAAVIKIVGGHMWRRYILGQDLQDIAETWERADSKPAVGIVERIDDEDQPTGPVPAGTPDAPETRGSG